MRARLFGFRAGHGRGRALHRDVRGDHRRGGRRRGAPLPAGGDAGLVFETYLQAQDTDIANNKRYTLHTDGKCITGTTTKGVFQPIDWDSTDANAKCRGIFIDTVDDLGAS